MSVTRSLDTLSHVTDDPSHPSAHIVKKEIFDPDVMKSLLSDERFASVDRARLKKYYKARSKSNEVQVVYNFGKGYETSQLGRLYPDYGLGLQSFSREIRNPLTAKYYWDIDIENAHFILAQRLAEERGLVTTSMKRYISNRDACLLDVSSNHNTAKVAFLKVLYGGDSSATKLYNPFIDSFEEPDGDMTFLNSIKHEVDALMDHIWFEYDNVRKHCLRKPNPKASVLSIVLQTLERQLLMSLDCYFMEKGRCIDVLIHDGGLVRKLDGESEFPTTLLRSAEEYLFSETGYNLRLVNKPIRHTYDLKPETLYIADGVSVEMFQKRKEEFERTHFYLRENGAVCEIRADGTLLMTNRDHSALNAASLSFEVRKESMIRQVAFFPLWINSRDRREYDKLVYKPDGICGDREYNTFVPLIGGSFYTVASVGNVASDAGLERFLEIALNLVKGNAAHCEYLLKWIALKIQKPWIVPGVCLVFTGPQGVGKSMFWGFIGNRLIGRSQYVYSDNIARDIFDTYSEAQMSNLLCLMEETSSSITRKMANELKAKITATEARINPKDVRPFSIDTYLSWVLLTNDASPVKLESGDRRYCVFNTGGAHKGDFAYWNETVELFARDEVAGAVFLYLKGLDLTGFIVNAFPVTELREIMMEAEQPIEEIFLKEIAGELEGDEWRGTNQAFYQLYVEWCRRFDIRPKSAVGFGREMTPYVLKGWVGKWGSNGSYGKTINLKIIRESEGSER
jgi:hypothetical protein